MVQLEPLANGLVQFVLVRVNELAPEPVRVVGENVTAAPVELLIVIVWVAAVDPTVVEPNVIDDGVIVSPAAALFPVPVSETVCGELVAESVIATLAVSVPAVWGSKLIVIAQFEPALIVCVQVPADPLNEADSVPVIVMPLMVTVAVPLFVSVIC